MYANDFDTLIKFLSYLKGDATRNIAITTDFTVATSEIKTLRGNCAIRFLNHVLIRAQFRIRSLRGLMMLRLNYPIDFALQIFLRWELDLYQLV